jgi:hypothetical protein
MDLRATREATKARVRQRTSPTTAGGREPEFLETPLRFGWDNEKRVRAGHWLLDAALLSLNCFKLGEDGIEIIAGSEAELDRLRDEMMRHDPAWRPFPEPPPDWTGFRKHYGDEFKVTFVSGARHQQEKAIRFFA